VNIFGFRCVTIVDWKMRLTLKIWMLVAGLTLFLSSVAGAVSFTATLDRDSMTVGEQATLSLTFEGGQPQQVPAPDVPGLSFSPSGTSQGMSLVNGSVTTTLSVNFTVSAQRPGDYTIPPMQAVVAGQQLTTDPIKLTVSKVSAPTTTDEQSGNEIAFMKLALPKGKLYLGQPLVGQLQLFLRDDVQQWANFQLNGMPIDGFSSGKLSDAPNQRRQVQIGNRRYTFIPIALPLTTTKTGHLSIGPVTASMVVVLPSQDQNQDPFFRQFFNQGQQKQMTLATELATAECSPLPEDNKPASFTGAIGDFTMTATAGPTNLTVGDPVTVRVQIAGSGNLDSLKLPTQDGWDHFKTYPPTSKLEASDQYGFQGTKTFEQIVSPENADVKELPPIAFSYFNPSDGQYHTLSHVAVALMVQSAGATPMPTMAAPKSATPENQAPQDILPIKENPGTVTATSQPLVSQPAFLAVQSLPIIVFCAAFVMRKRAENLANNPRLRRQRAVAQLVASGLTDLKKFASENKPDEFFALLFRLLQEQLGERLDCPASAITGVAMMDDQLKRLGASPATLQELHELFQLCDQARYAPVRGVSELNSLAGRFEKTVKELQGLKA